MKPSALLPLLALCLAACGSATPTPVAELSPSPTIGAPSPSPSQVPLTPSAAPSPTLALVEGETTTLVNVRSGPGTQYGTLGVLDEGHSVQADRLSEDGQWLHILYPSAPEGYGWVAALYVSLPPGSDLPRSITPTLTPSGPTGRVLIRLNVRQGPGTGFDTLGMLEADTLVVLTAKNLTASWFQIEYPAGSASRGWVTAQYIQTDSASELPVLDEYGQPLVTGTPGQSSALPTPTPTPGAAPEDGDSSASPAARITFSSAGTRAFTYSSLVSNPEGDPEDWLEFTPFASLPGAEARLAASLSCTGNGALGVELWQAGALYTGWGSLACGDDGKMLTLPAGSAYQLRLLAEPGAGLRFVHYSLTLENLP